MLRVNTERRFYPDLKIGVWRRERINFQKIGKTRTFFIASNEMSLIFHFRYVIVMIAYHCYMLAADKAI